MIQEKNMSNVPSVHSLRSADGTTISFHAVGTGEPIIVVGGSLRTAEDYFRFARVLAEQFTVHLVDRRGRGASGPLGVGYSLNKECEDLMAVQTSVGASLVFGHSYGGLIVLETTAQSNVFDRVALYEPGVSINGSLPTGWTGRYQQLLDSGDRRGAFAWFVQHSGHAPAVVAKLPSWYLKGIMRFVVRKDKWARMNPLLEANLLEHRQVTVEGRNVERFGAITADVLLLGGSRSPTFSTDQPFEALRRIVPRCTVEILDGLDHLAPNDKAPETVAKRVMAFMGT
jgi:pimeloyl-ACP methyl ester carboxylesterase